jgi:hypothetical protein
MSASDAAATASASSFTPRVHLHAEAQLRLGLVALGDGDVAHVVAEAGELERAGGLPPGRGALPVLDLPRTAGFETWPTTVLRATPRRVWM